MIIVTIHFIHSFFYLITHLYSSRFYRYSGFMRSKPKQQLPSDQLAMRNFTRKFIAALLFTIIAMMIFNGKRDGYTMAPTQNSGKRQRADDNLSSQQTTTQNDQFRYHNKQFTVTKVIDGDTFDINLPNGKYKTTRIRLLGVDTPEKTGGYKDKMYYGDEATKFTTDTIYKKVITIKLDITGVSRGKYGRLLCYVYTDKTTMLNEQIIKKGFGYSDPRFAHLYKTTFTKLEKQARHNKTGLWQKVTYAQLPYYHK